MLNRAAVSAESEPHLPLTTGIKRPKEVSRSDEVDNFFAGVAVNQRNLEALVG